MQSGRFFVIEHYGKTFVKVNADRQWQDTSNLLEAQKFNTKDEADTWIRLHTVVWLNKTTGEQSVQYPGNGPGWGVTHDTINFKPRLVEETMKVLLPTSPDRP
jgi:hypothetical protein